MITANCRDRLTAEDFDFVIETLAKSDKESVSLVKLLTDNETRDAILDHPRLFQSLLEGTAPLRISPQLYFYILTRHVLKETGLEDRALTDYVASVLERFSDRARMRSPATGATGPIQYVSDMLVALRQASPTQTFLIRAHIGNYSLFITGIFHESIESRAAARRAGPFVLRGRWGDRVIVSPPAIRWRARPRSARCWNGWRMPFAKCAARSTACPTSLLHLDSPNSPEIITP